MHEHPITRKTLILLCLILIVGGGVRVANLAHTPPGVWLDEAINGVEGIEYLKAGQFRVFYPQNSTEGLWVAIVGVSEKIFGVDRIGLRMGPAILGTLSIFVIFLFARWGFGDTVALPAAWFTATAFWHISFSRLAVNGAILVPLILSLSIYLLFVAQSGLAPHSQIKGAWRAWLLVVAGGFFYGLGFHSYIPFRISPLLIAWVFFVEVMRRRKIREPLRPWVSSFAVWLVTAAVVATPLGLYFLHHPEDFSHRMRQLTITQEQDPVRSEVVVIAKTLAMFNIHGDDNWRHNYGGSPQLLLPVGIFFLGGLGISVARIWKIGWQARVEAILIAWLVILLIPEMLTTEGIPHAMRTFGVTTPVFIFAGVGAAWAFDRARDRKLLSAALVVVLLLSGGYDIWRYLHDWPKHGAHLGNQTFNARLADVSNFLNSLPPATPRIVVHEDDPFVITRPELMHPPGRVDYTLPLPAQSIVFATMNNVEPRFLYFPEALRAADGKRVFISGTVIAPMEDRVHTLEALQEHGVRISIQHAPTFVYGVVQ